MPLLNDFYAGFKFATIRMRYLSNVVTSSRKQSYKASTVELYHRMLLFNLCNMCNV